MTWKRSRRGVSLPEILTTVALFALLVTGLATMGVTAITEWSHGSSQIMAENDASLALQLLGADARVGLRAYSNSTGSELYVVLPTVNAQGDYNRFAEGNTVRYYLTGSTLYRQVGSNTARVLARRVVAVSFAVNGPEIGLRLTSRQQNGKHIKQVVLSTQVTLRNLPPV